jgi:hypothetical protein
MKLRLSFVLILLFIGLSASVIMPAAFAASNLLDISVAKAPVAPDGTTARAAPDFVLTFADRDPAVPGVALQNGGTVEIILPPDFTNTGEGVNTVIILQGWPQSPRVDGPGFPYLTDIDGNTITLTLSDDWAAPGLAGPGPKQVHLLLLGFKSPGSGRYPVSLSIDPDGPGSDEADTYSGIGYAEIIPKARPAVNVVSLFSGPPGPPPPFFNPFYQTVPQSDPVARRVGVYLWNHNSKAAVGVDLVMTNPGHGRLVQKGRTVGQVLIQAPPGAMNYSLNTVMLPLGGPPSVQIDAFATGVPVGLLGLQFFADPSVTGDYAIDVSMNGGNTERLFVTVE